MYIKQYLGIILQVLCITRPIGFTINNSYAHGNARHQLIRVYHPCALLQVPCEVDTLPLANLVVFA